MPAVNVAVKRDQIYTLPMAYIYRPDIFAPLEGILRISDTYHRDHFVRTQLELEP